MDVRRLTGLALLGVLACACAGHDPYGQVSALADAGSCELALTAFSGHDSPTVSSAPVAVPHPRPAAAPADAAPAYALTASGSQSAVVLRVEGGVALGLGELDSTVSVPPLMPGVQQDEADFTPLSRAMRGVATCYEGRGDKGSLIMAFAQLQQIVESPLYGQTSEGEQQRVDAELDHVEGSLRALDPNYQQALAAKGRELDAAKSRSVYAH